MPLYPSGSDNTFIPRVVVDSLGLHNKLRTESGPASVQPDEVASVLLDIEQDLEDYDAEICRLRQDKEQLKQYAFQLRSLNSPIRKLPDEILQQIFDVCCDTNSFRIVDLKSRLPLSTSQALRTKPAMVISSVCSRWRRTALSMPVIWSRISVYWKKHASWENEDTEIFFPLSNFLNRSQQYPMTVRLEVKDEPNVFDNIIHPLLKQLFRQTARWQYLSYYGPESFTLGMFLRCEDIPSPSFPILRQLRIPAMAEPWELPPLMPNLQVLSLGSEISFPQRSDFLQLSHLDCGLVSYCPDNLSDKCPSLFSLGLPEFSVYGYFPEGSMMITDPSKLETLTIRHGMDDWHYYSEDSVFHILRLPSLKVLHLKKTETDYGKSDKSWSNLEPFLGFVQRSSFRLTTFSIHRLSISDGDLVYILVHFPTLQDLTVDDSGISPECSPVSPDFIESLHGSCTSSLRRQTAPMIPRLRSLRLLNVAATTFKDLSVVDMVRSRWWPTKLNTVGTSAFDVDCLRVLTMTFRNRPETEKAAGFYRLLGPLEQSGMMIVIQMAGVTLRD